MHKTISLSILALALAAGAAFACGDCPGDKKAEPAKTEVKAAKKKDCGDCPMHKKHGDKKPAGKMCGGVICPENIKGAKTSTVNIKDGVETTVTAKDADTSAQIQELALVHYAPKAEKCPGCPTTVPGAVTSVANIENGIKVTITAKDAATVAKIQAAAAGEHKGHAAVKEIKKEAKAAGRYMCAMKCVKSEKPGKCPKCGMPMNEIR